MKLSNDSHRIVHGRKNERSLCASIKEGNCTFGQYTTGGRRIWWPRRIVRIANVLISPEDPGINDTRACPFGLAPKGRDVRALIIDDHPLIQEAVSNVLRRLAPQVSIDAAGDCEHGLDLAGHGVEADLVLLDLNLPGLSGIAALKVWRNRYPDVPVVVLSAATDQQTVLAAIGAGAAGFIPKSSSNDVMLNALRLVLAGGRYLPPEVLARSGGDQVTTTQVRQGAKLSVETLGLSARQAEVLKLIASGASNKVICRELGLAERTVKAHVTAVFRALKVTSRTQAAIAAAKLGLVDSRRQSGRS
jgi:DNA-binding NarL/FixJ family response regulator